MGDRPKVTPGFVAEASERAPARLVKKLDASPRLADAWTWAEADGGWTVTTDG